MPLFEFLFDKAPQIVTKRGDAQTALLAEAYGWCCFAVWQCQSAFPAFSNYYADYLQTALKAKKREPYALLLARMMVEFNASEDRCGLNKWKLTHPEVFREAEALMHAGKYDPYLKAEEKYGEYVSWLEGSPEFAEEWAAIKKAFPNECAKPIVRRTLIPERNWVQEGAANFNTPKARFQTLFDFFCWKYFLWGMEGDTPLLLKISVVPTPHGTQIFIPGYLSFDPRRDLNYPAITRLHRARGVSRQGPGFSVGRQELAELERKVLAADKEARSKGLKGTKRYLFICDTTNYRDHGDFRRLRKLLANAKKKKRFDKQ